MENNYFEYLLFNILFCIVLDNTYIIYKSYTCINSYTDFSFIVCIETKHCGERFVCRAPCGCYFINIYRFLQYCILYYLRIMYIEYLLLLSVIIKILIGLLNNTKSRTLWIHIIVNHRIIQKLMDTCKLILILYFTIL